VSALVGRLGVDPSVAPRGAPQTSDVGAERRRSNPTFVASIVVVALAVFLRTWQLGRDRLGFDEAFTAMAGRRSLGGLFAYLRVRDSHPPLDYLLRSPLSRAGLSEVWMRLPSVLCSIAAVALVAWWLRHRGVVGLLATAFMAFSAFEVVHGREVRMYADLQLLGVAAAMVCTAWLTRPRRRHVLAIGALVAIGLLLHTSMLIFGAGLLMVPGVRRDADAWRWRGALLAGFAVWALVWGPAFLHQAGGGHSDWIPRTTVSRAVDAVGRLLIDDPSWHVAIVVGVVVGVVVMWRVDPHLARVVTCCSFVPLVLAALAGLVAPVLLDRTLTLMAWGPMVSLAFLARAAPRRKVVRSLVYLCLGVLALVMAASAWQSVTTRTQPDRVLRHLEAAVRPGDVVVLRPGGRLHLLEWTLGVRHGRTYRVDQLTGVAETAAFQLDGQQSTNTDARRVWFLDWKAPHLAPVEGPHCGPDWPVDDARLSCLLASPSAARAVP
jgi:hypothetical protein